MTILDWGGDPGENTPFRGKCKSVDILDISDKAIVPGCKKVSRESARTKKYDLIVCSNVLEHVPYPSELLLEIRRAMHQESVLYCEVPFEELMRINQVDPYLYKKHWHEHINFFSEDSLHALAEKTGLLIIELKKIKVSVDKNPWLFQLALKLK